MFAAKRIFVGCLAVLGLAVCTPQASAGFTTYSFIHDQSGLNFPPPNGPVATITLYDGTDAVSHGGTAGSVVVKLDVNVSFATGDLFALYGNVRTDLIGSLTLTKLDSTPSTATLSNYVQASNSINQVGSSNPTSINPIDPVFDLGVQFGVQGAAGGNVTSITFQATSSLDSTLQIGDLSLLSGIADDPLGFLRFGLRIQSTPLGGGSLKMYIDGNQPPDQNPPGSVPAPPAIILLATALPVLGLRRYLRRKTV